MKNNNMKKKILVTGGSGYIGSHTIVELINAGYEIISIDNYSSSHAWIMDKIEEIVNQKINYQKLDLCDWEATNAFFDEHNDIEGIIHFAAYKTVPESMAKPLMYYENNIFSLVNILKCVDKHGIKNFVFSSSCSVYGNAKTLPVTEETPFEKAESPYGRTKQMGEQILEDFAETSSCKISMLRYFNPVGAHESGKIGDLPLGTPNNLVPFITQTAIGKREILTVFGNDYPTRDGTCLRDYIHVTDISLAHIKALERMMKNENEKQVEVFNLGSGNGVTVQEVIDAFIKVTGVDLNYKIGEKRLGDVAAIYADNQKSKDKLNWQAQKNIEEMMASAWKWEKQLS